MQTLVTNGIRILVESMFVPEQTSMQRNHVVFAYRIHMVNETNDTVQLLLRHWEISDSNGETRAVDGEGVIGKQPVLQPGQGHTYISGCVLNSLMGKMEGYYTFRRLSDGSAFQVRIPEFTLMAPFLMN